MVSGTVIGLLLGGVFIVGGLIVREIPVVAELITRLLRYSDQGSWRLTMAVALLAAVGEEMFYRGALYTALGRHHPLLISTVIYAIATLASSRNPMLAFAAIILGTVCALERRATGGVLAPILTHFVWTLVVLLGLPPLVRFVSARAQISVKAGVRRCWKALAPSRKSCDCSSTD